ncbi:UNVERIFIED_CONTAM: hypothetical protein GTU68_061265 [Idotea baltica]|nr:hypothetical protein [Idotea baltica]
MSFPKPFYRWRPHPWHGLDVGKAPPYRVHAFIEITPFDLVKYEVDKSTGYMRVDRPQRTSSQPPALYGFIPRTFCGDADPLDICVVSERPIARSEMILDARVVGGLPMCDNGEADDKIIAVLETDNLWSNVDELDDLPTVLVERLRHYFSTYKMTPDSEATVSIDKAYGREQAAKVIAAAMQDYDDEYGDA